MSVTLGFALIVGGVLATFALAFTFAFVGDWVCLALSAAVGVVATVIVADTSIAFLGPVLHGVLAGLCFFIATGAAATLIFPLASLPARLLGRRRFLNSDDYMPFGPEAGAEPAWFDGGTAIGDHVDAGGHSRY